MFNFPFELMLYYWELEEQINRIKRIKDSSFEEMTWY